MVSREIRRNMDIRSGQYRFDLAQRKYEKRPREKPKKIYFTESIRAYVEEKLSQKYSPEPIVGECCQRSISCVSVERIYQLLQDKKRKSQLFEYLRTQVSGIKSEVVARTSEVSSRTE